MILTLCVLIAGYVADAPLNLIPTPEQVVRHNGSFRFDEDVSITCDLNSKDDRFAASELNSEIESDLGLRLGESTRSSRTVNLRRASTGKGYELMVTPDHIEITAPDGEGVFDGVQTLKQLIRANRQGNSIPACSIVDRPVFQYRGWQDDISRGPIPTLDFLKKEIRTLSEFKLNLFTLYTEHVFRLKKHPTIAPQDGITAEEIAELSRYAAQYHVEVAGNFQSFGHFANILKVPGYENLGETKNVLSPAKEESYKFLDDVYSEIAPAYSSPLFDINCDEVSGLGQGASKDLVSQIGVAGVYAQHINRISDLLHKYRKTPMMWGDIALNFPAIVPKLPKDLIVLPWAYDARASFQNQIQPFTKYGLRFMVSPGVSCWSQIWPNLQNATTNISNFVRDGASNGAMGMLNTSWDDDGQNLFSDNWYEMVWGAECAWKPVKLIEGTNPDDVRQDRVRSFDSMFDSTFYGIRDHRVATALNDLSALRHNPIAGGLGNRAFWRDPMAEVAKLKDRSSIQPYLDQVRAIAGIFVDAKRHARHNAESLDYAIFAAKQAEFLGTSLQAADTGKNPGLTKTVEKLKRGYTGLWFRENHRWWLDRNLPRFDDLAKRVMQLGSPTK